jgi:hypothetical protein
MSTEMRDLPYLIGDIVPVYMEASYMGRRVTSPGGTRPSYPGKVFTLAEFILGTGNSS